MEETMSHARWILAASIGLAGLALSSPTRAELSEEEVLAKFKHEPTVQQVQDAAIRYYQVHPDRISSLRTNAQLKALVPTISGGFTNSLTSTNRSMNDGLYLALKFKEDERITGDSRGFSVSATWSLDRLVFNAEVLDVQSLIGILDGVVREVTTIYYIRRRLQIDNVLRPPTDLATKISQSIRIDELTGLLDAMTGGFMSKSLRSAKPAPHAVIAKPALAARPAPRKAVTPAAVALPPTGGGYKSATRVAR
jgi:hypothetical protein